MKLSYIIVVLGLCLPVVSCRSKRVPVSEPHAVTVAEELPDRSSPEKTLRTFWGAIKAGNTALALSCTSPERIRQGHHGRDVRKLIAEYKAVDTNTFRFIGGAGSSCSIESPNHCMDYDMEKNEKGEWVIISIHP